MDLKKTIIEETIPDGWLPTKEVAEGLKVLPASIRVYRSRYSMEFEGEVRRFLRKHEGKLREHLFWSPKAQKILAFGIKNDPVAEWKEKVTNEVIEKGAIITSEIKSMELVKIVAQQIVAIVENYERMDDRVKKLELKDQINYVTPRTKKKCRDLVARVVSDYNLEWQSIWIPKRNKYEFNNYDDMTEEIAQNIIKELEMQYPLRDQQRRIINIKKLK